MNGFSTALQIKKAVIPGSILFLLFLLFFPGFSQAMPVADFSGSPTNGYRPLTVQFTDSSTSSTGLITSWSWDFGDGVGTSTAQNPSYTYTSTGSFTVVLTVTDSEGSDAETKVNYITVTEAPPVADFSGTPISGIKPLTVQFTDASTGVVTSWSWDFGDGGTSTLQSPGHTYTSVGTFTVTLTVTGPGGSDAEIKTGYITVSEPPPVADFSGTPTNGLKPLTVQFTDASTGVINSWSWDFGDGVGTSTLQNPSYTYTTAGTFTVTLTVTGPGGSDAEIKTGYISVTEAPPVANFTGYPTSGTRPLSVKFTDASTGVITSWSWDFGDGGTSTIQSPGHTYTTAGTFTVTLTVTGPGGSNTLIRAGYISVSGVPPVANFSANPTNGVKPLTVQFSDQSTNCNSWLWDFGDGSTSTAQNPYHTYSSIGTFTVTLTVTGPDGSNAMQKVDYIHVTDIIVDRSPGNVTRPQVAADGIGHVYAVWEDTRNGSSDIYFNYSSDYGFTWQANDIRIDTDIPGANHSNSPRIACDNNGHVYVVWEDERNGSSDIYFNYSSNHGVTWQSSDKKLSSAAYAPPPQFPKVACDNSGHVYVAWDDNYFNTSSDYGVTWLTQAVRISTSGGIENQLACDQNGHVYVAWRKGTSEVLFNYSLDGGNTWQTVDRRISNVGAIPYGLSLASDENGHVYCAWHDGRNNATSPDIYFNSSSDYGNTWGASDIMLNTGTPGATYSIWPEVACDETGHVFVTWYDRRNGLGDIYLNLSLDYGVSWQVSDKRLDTDTAGVDSGYPEIASDGSGHILAIWTDDQAGIGPGLYLNYSLDNGANWLSTNRKIGSGGFNPQMVTDGSRFYIVTDNDDIVFNEVAPLQIPPFAPADPSPVHGATQVSLTPVLIWRFGDANLDDTLTYDIYFGTSSPPPLVSPNQSETTYLPGTLTYLTIYYWQVVARDQLGAETVGSIWSFTTLSGPPQFVDFSPPDGATGVGLTTTLSWTAVDDPGDTLTYDVYFGTINPPPRQITNYAFSTYSPGLLTHYTVYYWRIIARDNHGTQTVGPILSFTTINNPPQFKYSSPSDGATGVVLTPTLKWSASDPEPDDTLTYDIYFGTSSPPPLVLSNQTTTSYSPGQLTHFTTYYWKVVARDHHGAETELPVLSFTTLNNPPQFLTFSPPHMSTGVSLTPTLSWSALDPDGDPLTYDIYFGTSSSPPLVLSNQTATTYQPERLSSLTRYYWKVVARDHHGAEKAMPVMYFTTKSESPQISNLSPVDGATGIELTPTLSWSAFDPDPTDTITFDIYFGTSSSPPRVASNQTAMTYKPSVLSALTVYYWKIVAIDNHGDKAESPVLSFTTVNRPPEFQGFLPADLSSGVSTKPKPRWAASDPDPGDTITYDVYFGTSSPPPLVVSNQTATYYWPGELLAFTSYYWKVVARDNHGAETVGHELMFTTGPPAPYIAYISPNPCPTSEVFSIIGENFGDTQGSSVLVFARSGKKWVFRSGNASIKMWSDTRIDFKVPDFPTQPSGWTTTFKLAVGVNGTLSNIVQLTITKP